MHSSCGKFIVKRFKVDSFLESRGLEGLTESKAIDQINHEGKARSVCIAVRECCPTGTSAENHNVRRLINVREWIKYRELWHFGRRRPGRAAWYLYIIRHADARISRRSGPFRKRGLGFSSGVDSRTCARNLSAVLRRRNCA